MILVMPEAGSCFVEPMRITIRWFVAGDIKVVLHIKQRKLKNRGVLLIDRLRRQRCATVVAFSSLPCLLYHERKSGILLLLGSSNSFITVRTFNVHAVGRTTYGRSPSEGPPTYPPPLHPASEEGHETLSRHATAQSQRGVDCIHEGVK